MSGYRSGSNDSLGIHIRLDSRNGWIAGVCAGIANALKTDPAFVRTAVAVCALFFPKLTIAAYLIAWAVFDHKDRRSEREGGR
ncbi:MAG: PspC domain-containing protein [Pseudomonadales bacterium]|nr:PspC domain-containing protein [Pseudomonadales bacterium]